MLKENFKKRAVSERNELIAIVKEHWAATRKADIEEHKMYQKRNKRAKQTNQARGESQEIANKDPEVRQAVNDSGTTVFFHASAGKYIT